MSSPPSARGRHCESTMLRAPDAGRPLEVRGGAGLLGHRAARPAGARRSASWNGSAASPPAAEDFPGYQATDVYPPAERPAAGVGGRHPLRRPEDLAGLARLAGAGRVDREAPRRNSATSA